MTVALQSSIRIREGWSSGESARANGRWKMVDRVQLQPSKNPRNCFRVPTSAPIQNQKSKILSFHLPSSVFHLRENAPAFSLVELLAVVGIIAMLSVAAVPVMRGLGGSQSSRATAQILVSALEQARTAAILSGTNAYLAIPDASFPATNYRFRSYVLFRPTVDQDANSSDDFQTNVAAPGWVLLSKWEKLPGDLLFSTLKLNPPPDGITGLNVSQLMIPGSGPWSGTLPAIGFTPSGGLVDPSGTAGLLFASSNKVSNGVAAVADRIDISLYSGRVRYTGIVTNTNF
jgi:type II secretory pathway pseudopilin PulG